MRAPTRMPKEGDQGIERITSGDKYKRCGTVMFLDSTIRLFQGEMQLSSIIAESSIHHLRLPPSQSERPGIAPGPSLFSR
jgi:hypothetical protein